MQTYVVANWKLNPPTPRAAKQLSAALAKKGFPLAGVEVVVCPPYPFLSEVAGVLAKAKIKLGVQTIAAHESGAHTGEVSLSMVTPYNVTYVLLGHSERRALGETNEAIVAKVSYALKQGMTVVACVGERERSDEGAHYTFVAEEVRAILAALKRKDLSRFLFAYEPIWAIGKSAAGAMTTEELFEMVLFIRKLMAEKFGRSVAQNVPILYGGSVKAVNAASLIRQGGVQGLLVGSASLDVKEFRSIVTAVAGA